LNREAKFLLGLVSQLLELVDAGARDPQRHWIGGMYRWKSAQCTAAENKAAG
jgi:hypothetical protein